MLSLPVMEIDEAIGQLSIKLINTVRKYDGLVLAAPRIGVLKRVIVVRYNPNTDHERAIIMINPVIIKRSQITHKFGEWCLSLPNQELVYIDRPHWITVQYQDLKNNIIESTEDGIIAACIQHEIDHLNGRLIIDYLDKDNLNID